MRSDDGKQKIAGIGITGLVGSRVVELLSDTYDFENFSTETGFDITKPDSLSPLRNSDAQTVLHLAAKTDVDGCERDKPQGKDGPAWKINVEGTQNIVQICKDTGKKMIYVSTDFVFDGMNPPANGYSEDDTPNPQNWYATTKYEGEKIVQALENFLIVRLAYPYRSHFEGKLDFVRAIKSRLEKGLPILAITDHYMTPTYIDDFAFALDALIIQGKAGIYHAVGSEVITPYDASMLIADAFELDGKLVSRTTREEYFQDKAPRPFNLSLKNAKIAGLGARFKTFREGLEAVKEQL